MLISVYVLLDNCKRFLFLVQILSVNYPWIFTHLMCKCALLNSALMTNRRRLSGKKFISTNPFNFVFISKAKCYHYVKKKWYDSLLSTWTIVCNVGTVLKYNLKLWIGSTAVKMFSASNMVLLLYKSVIHFYHLTVLSPLCPISAQLFWISYFAFNNVKMLQTDAKESEVWGPSISVRVCHSLL